MEPFFRLGPLLYHSQNKGLSEVYIEPYQTSMVKTSCENSQRLIFRGYKISRWLFSEKVPSWIFDEVLKQLWLLKVNNKANWALYHLTVDKSLFKVDSKDSRIINHRSCIQGISCCLLTSTYSSGELI